MKKIILLSFLFSQTITCAFAQREQKQKESYKRKADLEFKDLKFRSAITLYLLSDTTRADVIGNLALAHKWVKDYDQAAHWYAKQAALPNQPDQLLLDYAEILANTGNHRLAAEQYAAYSAKFPSDRRARNLAGSYDLMAGFYADSANWKIDFPSFNTNKDEFSPAYFGKGLIFVSNRDKRWGIKSMFGWNQTAFTDLFSLEDTSFVTYSEPKPYFIDTAGVKNKNMGYQRLPVSVNDNQVLGDITYPKTTAGINGVNDYSTINLLSRKVNSFYHDGPATFTSDQKVMFYNRNHVVRSDNNSKEGILKLNLYSASYQNGSWSNIQPFKYNSPEYSVAHPALSADGNVLYFVSDKPGGQGGKDLYYSTRTNGGEWGEPVNLGPLVNTEGDETFPYVAADGKLYFSSNGHAGLGGLDLFNVKLENNLPAGAVSNMGYPVNSIKDDFGIIFDTGLLGGYFSSNRFGTDDIFRFGRRLVELELEGMVVAKGPDGVKRALGNSTIVAEHNGKTDNLTTDQNGRFKLDLQQNTEYKLTASKPGFTTASSTVNTSGITRSGSVNAELMIEPVFPPKPKETECQEITRRFTMSNVYYDLDKSTIRPDAARMLDNLLILMKQYPELTAVVVSHTDSRASAAYNMKLSQRRSEAAIQYLVDRGIDRSRFTSEFHGKSKLVNECAEGMNCDEWRQQQNRRSEFVLKYNGKFLDCK